MIHACALYMNLRKRLRLLLRLFFSWTPSSIQNRLEEPIYAYFLIYMLDTSIKNLSLVYFRLKTAASSDILYL